MTDVIFTNEKGDVTEGAISNIFAEINDVLVTPPVKDGLLPGIMRQTILDSNRATRVASLTIHDLRTASALYISNSVRGLVPVTLLNAAPISFSPE